MKTAENTQDTIFNVAVFIQKAKKRQKVMGMRAVANS